MYLLECPRPVACPIIVCIHNFKFTQKKNPPLKILVTGMNRDERLYPYYTDEPKLSLQYLPNKAKCMNIWSTSEYDEHNTVHNEGILWFTLYDICRIQIQLVDLNWHTWTFRLQLQFELADFNLWTLTCKL